MWWRCTTWCVVVTVYRAHEWCGFVRRWARAQLWATAAGACLVATWSAQPREAGCEVLSLCAWVVLCTTCAGCGGLCGNTLHTGCCMLVVEGGRCCSLSIPHTYRHIRYPSYTLRCVVVVTGRAAAEISRPPRGLPGWRGTGAAGGDVSRWEVHMTAGHRAMGSGTWTLGVLHPNTA